MMRLVSAAALCAALAIAPAAAFADDDPGVFGVAGATATPEATGSSDEPAPAASEQAATDDEGEGEGIEVAVPDYSSMSLDDLKSEVKKKTAERDEAKTAVEKLDGQIAGVLALLEDEYSRVDATQALAERSVRARYKVQQQYGSLIDTLLRADDFDSFIAGVEYIEEASEASVDGLVTLRRDIERNEREKVRLQEEKASADELLSRVETELEAATKARDEAQRLADMVANAKLKPDGANWNAGKKAFIKEWGPRIDAYLAGSPMAKQGNTFAEAAWKNHIDPRFSPAISNIESSKGRICIRPYNAWGWGAAEPNPAGLASSWSSWKEAINAHVKGLKSGYGYSITQEGAKKYCPPNWQLWYATTVDQMNSI